MLHHSPHPRLILGLVFFSLPFYPKYTSPAPPPHHPSLEWPVKEFERGVYLFVVTFFVIVYHLFGAHQRNNETQKVSVDPGAGIRWLFYSISLSLSKQAYQPSICLFYFLFSTFFLLNRLCVISVGFISRCVYKQHQINWQRYYLVLR